MRESMDGELDPQEVTDLAQKLYNDDGNSGNLYRQSPEMTLKYEGKAVDILQLREDVHVNYDIR
jgi:hypothetical protein